MKNLISSLKIIVALFTTQCFVACSVVTNSKPYKIYKSGEDLYLDAQETGDYTWFIIFVVLLIVVGILYFMKKK